MTLAREMIEALRSYGGFIPPKQMALVLLRTLRERGPSEGMLSAAHKFRDGATDQILHAAFAELIREIEEEQP